MTLRPPRPSTPSCAHPWPTCRPCPRSAPRCSRSCASSLDRRSRPSSKAARSTGARSPSPARTARRSRCRSSAPPGPIAPRRRPASTGSTAAGWSWGTASRRSTSRWSGSTEFGAVVISVDYRLAPEATGTTLVDDCYQGLLWVAEHAAELGIDPARIVVAGASAGGGLAAGVTLMARDRGTPAIAAQVLICPMLDHRNSTTSSRQYSGGPGVWTRRDERVRLASGPRRPRRPARCPPTSHPRWPTTCRACRPPTSTPAPPRSSATRTSTTPPASGRPAARPNCTSGPAASTDSTRCSRRRASRPRPAGPAADWLARVLDPSPDLKD